MKTASPLLGRKFGEGRLRRHRETIARLEAAGHKFGAPVDPRTRIEKRICQLPSCGREFDFKVLPKGDPKAGRYCKQIHATQHTAILRRKCPADYKLLYDLYAVKNMTTVEIAEMFGTQHQSVRKRMIDVGIPRRKVGHSRIAACTEPGCGEPVLKLRHPQSGSSYGTKCEGHYWAHRKFLYSSRYKRIQASRGNIPGKITKQLHNGATTSHEIAKRLNVPVKVVSTSMGHLQRRGEVECCGVTRADRDGQRYHVKLWRIVERRMEAIAC